MKKTGISVFPKSALIEKLHESLNPFWNIECYLEFEKPSDANILFASKNNDRILGAIFKIYQGHIILLPNLTFRKFNIRERSPMLINEAREVGNRLKQCLSDIHNNLNSKEDKSPRPSWAEYTEFELVDSIKLLHKIEKNIEIIENLTVENDRLLEEVKQIEILKNLLYETGKQLENGVIEALKILGYQAENFDNGVLELDQVITSPEGDRYIGECEGKDNKAIDITKFRQLQDNLNEDFHREDVEEKAFGLLFGNPQRLLNPKERTDDFTIKCKNGAKREMIGLVNTVDLFKVARYLSENDNEPFKIKCREIIKEQLGGVIKFPNLPT